MKNNLVLTVFKTESEAFQAFKELSANPKGTNYSAPDAALIKKNKEGGIDTIEVIGALPTDHTAAGAIIGSLIGLLGGPLGVLLGAAIGGVAGQAATAEEVIDEASVIAVIASKIYEGEVAIAALVEEEEPAFDAAFAKYDTTIMRYDAETIAAEAKQFKEQEVAAAKQAYEEACAEVETEVDESPEAPAEQPEQPKEELTGWRSATNRALEN